MNHLRNALLTLFAIFALALVVRADVGPDPREVYDRLIAPCCWNQTLDIHDSELATKLRVEIAERLQQGELPTAIEDDMAARFGERIRAVPRARDPRQTMALSMVGAMVMSLLGLLLLARRWLKRRLQLLEPQGEEAPWDTQPRSEYDAQLDRELSRRESLTS